MRDTELALRDERGRPLADDPLRHFIGAMVAANAGTLGHVDPNRILVIAGAARHGALASIRPLTFGGSPPALREGTWIKPSVTVRGVAMRYEICLRPRFFLDSTAADRGAILAHELWHISPSFDGTLAESRRHGPASPVEIEREIGALVDRWRAAGGRAAAILAHQGELRLDAWLARPASRMPMRANLRTAYDERDLYSAIIEQRS